MKQIPPRPTEKNTVLFVCDIQETFVGPIKNLPEIIRTTEFLVKSAKSLQIPIMVTEQLPFKPTVPEILSILPEGTPVSIQSQITRLDSIALLISIIFSAIHRLSNIHLNRFIKNQFSQ